MEGENTETTQATTTKEEQQKFAFNSEKTSALERELNETKAKLAKWEKEQRDAKDKDRLTKGEHERLIAEKTAELEAKESALKAFENATNERAGRLLSKLPEAKRERVTKYKDKLPLADWVTMIEDEMETTTETTTETQTKVPGGTPSGGTRQSSNGMRELNPRTIEILDQLGVNPEHGQRLMAQRKEGGNAHFLPTIRVFIEGLKKAARGGRIWSTEESNKGRKGG